MQLQLEETKPGFLEDWRLEELRKPNEFAYLQGISYSELFVLWRLDINKNFIC